jgi:hypothetical protein
MKAAEILRTLADMIEQNSSNNNQVVDPAAGQIAKPETADACDDAVPTMVSPLQQKLELLKKVSGVSSHYDEEVPQDELDVIRHSAGVAPIVCAVDSDDIDSE